MIHLLIGIQGSGKTTFSKVLSKKLNCQIVSSDGTRNLHPTWTEDLIWPEIYRLIAEEVRNGKDVIFDATNITQKVRKRFIDNMKEHLDEFHLAAYFIDTPLDECIKRVEIRNTLPNERILPIEVISSYHNSLIMPTFDEGFEEINIVQNEQIVKTIKKDEQNEK